MRIEGYSENWVFPVKLGTCLPTTSSRILQWPGYRVYRHAIDEKNKTLELWVRRKRGNRKLECSGCGRKFEEAYDANERAVRDLPWSKIADLEAKHEYGKAIDVTKQTLRYFPRNHRNHRLQGELKALKQRAKEQKRQHRGEASQRKTESHRDSETAGTAGRAASKGLRTIWRR